MAAVEPASGAGSPRRVAFEMSAVQEDDELQQALNASREAFEEDQIRQAMQDSVPQAWTQQQPKAATDRRAPGAGPAAEGCADPGIGKDLTDVLPSPWQHGLASLSARMPPSKRARYAWTKDSNESPVSADTSRLLAETEAADLWQMLFGANAEETDVDRWLRSAFVFVGSADGGQSSMASSLPCPWGLRQEHGGPCGVLAAVQAFIVRELLWGSVEDSGDESLSQASTTAGTESDADAATSSMGSPLPMQSPDTCETNDNAALASTLVDRLHKLDRFELLACALTRILYAATPCSRYVWVEVIDQYSMMRHEFSSAVSLVDWLIATKAFEDSPSSLLSFVCSLVLTRGVEAVHSDMDEASSPLIGLFGHCSQELVNLCLVGRAVTNVFDGSITFEDEQDVLSLQGIEGLPPIGFLSALEPLKYCEVGQLYKHPKFPLWVIGTSSHYSLLISTDCRVNHTDGAPVETRDQVSTHTTRCGVCGGTRSGPPCRTLLHFNGKDFGAEKPTLAPVDLQLPSTEDSWQPKALLTGDQDFAEVLHTRWPGATVSYPQVGDSTIPASPPRIQ